MKKDKKTRINISISQSVKNRIDKINKDTGGSINWSNLIEMTLEPQIILIEKYVEGYRGKELFEEKLRYLLRRNEIEMSKLFIKDYKQLDQDLLSGEIKPKKKIKR